VCSCTAKYYFTLCIDGAAIEDDDNDKSLCMLILRKISCQYSGMKQLRAEILCNTSCIQLGFAGASKCVSSSVRKHSFQYYSYKCVFNIQILNAPKDHVEDTLKIMHFYNCSSSVTNVFFCNYTISEIESYENFLLTAVNCGKFHVKQISLYIQWCL